MGNRKMKDDLLWVDIETTDLEPKGNELLEVALVLTDKRLNIISELSLVIKSNFDWEHGNNVVRDMHTKSGLIDETRQSRLTLTGAEAKILGWIILNNAVDLPMAGSMVHFDREWLKAKMPKVEQLFHYRNFDVTTLRCFLNENGGDSNHRALADLQFDIEQTRKMLASLDLEKSDKKA